jgi:23S rRNA (cytosine1962-C5)-methyltransferase
MLNDFILCAIEARADLLTGDHQVAVRMFAGFYEGCPELVIDLYAKTLVLFGYAQSTEENDGLLAAAQKLILEQLPWLESAVQKQRFASDLAKRSGIVSFGDKPSTQIREHGVWYALNLLMNQDTSFYLDTRHLRQWLLENATGWSVLNTFAYTGSLGLAALAGGADRIVQTDRNPKFLAVARQGGMINRLDIGKMKLRAGDFFSEVARLKRSSDLFDCAIIDPPFFSTTKMGTVDLVNESTHLINKVRPLIRDGGWLVAINNALFLSGADYIRSLDALCADGYLSIEQLIPVPADITGYPQTIVGSPPSDPAPFNHPTKIVLLRVRRKG